MIMGEMENLLQELFEEFSTLAKRVAYIYFTVIVIMVNIALALVH